MSYCSFAKYVKKRCILKVNMFWNQHVNTNVFPCQRKTKIIITLLHGWRVYLIKCRKYLQADLKCVCLLLELIQWATMALCPSVTSFE